MGIDIYTRWPGMTPDEEAAQITGFSIVSGKVGYLREAYHGGPYVTQVLVPEAFGDDVPEEGIGIPAATLRARLPAARQAFLERVATVYKDQKDDPIWDRAWPSFEDFVALCEAKEADTGEPVLVCASA